MKLKAATAGKLASLSALGAGALVMSAGDADASTIFTDLSANPSASVGYTSGYQGSFSTTNAGHAGVGFRFFTNSGSHRSGTSGTRLSVRFSGRGGAQFATSAGMLKLFVAGSHLGGAGVSAVGSAAYRSFWKTRNTHYHSAQGYSAGSSGNTHFVTTEPAFTSTTYAYGHRAVPKPFADMYALFKFNVGTHSDYGWVELSLINNVDTSGRADNLGPDLQILGWAFDDTGAQIGAGDVGSVPEPGTFAMTGLAALALGAEGIRRWRAAKAAQKSWKLLLIGWDAADWKVIRPLLAKGEMPNLARLMSQGSHGNIATLYPPLSPMLWTSIGTGKRPFKHGIHGFIEATEDGMHVRPITNLGRTTKAVWNILNQHGKRSIVVGWWPSHPAEPIRGAMVSNHYPMNGDVAPDSPMQAGTVSPLELAGALAELRVHPVEVSGGMLRMFAPDAAKVDQEKDRGLHDLANIVAETMSIHNAATELMARQDWDLAAVYYSSIDHFSHRFMRDHAKKRRGKAEDPGIYDGIVANAYRYHDAMLGRLLELAGNDCAVMLLSDHGFHSDALLPDYIPAEAAGPAVEHRHFGILCMRAPGVPAGGQIYGASVLDITPTVLHLFGLPAGSDMDGKVLINAFPGQKEIERIPSWDQVPGEDGRHPAAFQFDSTGAAESMQQLVDLGYVAPLTEDASQNVARAVTESRYNLARALLDAGQFEKGAEILTELIAQDPEQGRYHSHLVQCRLQQGRTAECKKCLDAFDRACAEYAPRATEELKRRRGEKPDEDLGRDEKGERRERQLLAEKAYGQVMERLLLHAQLALSQRKSKPQRELARATLEKLAAMTGKSASLGMFLGRGFGALGEHTKALDYLGRVLAEDPEHFEAISLRAQVQFAAKNYDSATESAIESLALVYLQPRTHLLLGASLERMGEPAVAEQEYRVAVAQAPGLVAGHLALARLLRCDPARLGEASERMARANLLREAAKKKRAVKESDKVTLEGKDPKVVTDAALPRTLALWGRGGTEPPVDRNRVVTVVAGLPRSGTSMMMQMLVSGGIAAYTDEVRAPDDDNPRGYFEHANATLLHRDSTWVPEARGKVVKIVGHLLPHLPVSESYRIVFMHRDLQDVVASQSVMLKRLARRGARMKSQGLAQVYSSQLVRIEEWLKRSPQVDVLGVSYELAVANPQETAARLAAFLGGPFDVARAASSVEPALQRQRAAQHSDAAGAA